MSPTSKNVGPWKRDGQSWVRRFVVGDGPERVAVRACDNREGGWTAFPHTSDGESLTPVGVPPQRRKAALAALDAALGLTP